MDPYQIVWSIALDDRLTESSVRLDIGFPVLRVKF